jgi:hypothetical protein
VVRLDASRSKRRPADQSTSSEYTVPMPAMNLESISSCLSFTFCFVRAAPKVFQLMTSSRGSKPISAQLGEASASLPAAVPRTSAGALGDEEAELRRRRERHATSRVSGVTGSPGGRLHRSGCWCP